MAIANIHVLIKYLAMNALVMTASPWLKTREHVMVCHFNDVIFMTVSLSKIWVWVEQGTPFKEL